MDRAKLPVNVRWAADNADIATGRALNGLSGQFVYACPHDRDRAPCRRYDGAKAFVSVVGAPKVSGRIIVSQPHGPRREDHAAINLTGLPWSSVAVRDEGAQLPLYQFGHLILLSRSSGTRLQLSSSGALGLSTADSARWSTSERTEPLFSVRSVKR